MTPESRQKIGARRADVLQGGLFLELLALRQAALDDGPQRQVESPFAAAVQLRGGRGGRAAVRRLRGLLLAAVFVMGRSLVGWD